MRKMLHAPALLVHATAVRVPVLVGHSVSLALSLRRETTPAEARRILAAFPGMRVLDEPWTGEYPTPLRAAGIDDILVGRVRPRSRSRERPVAVRVWRQPAQGERAQRRAGRRVLLGLPIR